MHWFDRLSRQLAAAPETQATRRGVLKGVGVAAVATPFASDAVAYANNYIKARSSSTACTACLQQAMNDYRTRLQLCYDGFGLVLSASPYAGLAAAKKKKKKKKKRAVTVPADLGGLNCLSFARLQFVQEAKQCRTGPACAPTPTPPSPPTTVSGSTTCPAGTNPCPSTGGTNTCCYAGDACCPCGNVTGGYICCAGVIGCVCC